MIGKRWLALVPQIDRLADEKNGIAKFAEFQERLVKADRLGRVVDAGAPPVDGTEPTVRLRKTRVHDVLLAMAGRAWLDHWYAEDPKETPYYQFAGSRFIGDASKLIPQSPLLQAAREGLARPGKLELKGRPRLLLTSERSAALLYTVSAAGHVPEHGYAVVKPVADRLLEIEGAQTDFRAVSRDAKNDSIEFAVQSPLVQSFETDRTLNRPQPERTSLKVVGNFRGQPFDLTTKIELHPVPDTVAIGPPAPDPPDAHIAIRASREIIGRFGAGNGSIAIVLDCSGSMSEPPNAPKFPQATSALRQVLSQVPAGTMVSVWTFSQLPDKFRDQNGKPIPAPPELKAEADLLVLEPERTIQSLRAPAPWADVQTDGLIRKLEDLLPWFQTPLVEAMLKAAQTDLRAAKGLKTLLVLTDGADNRLEKGAAINPDKLTIPNFITDRFKPLGVRINMVFFTPAGDRAEIDEAKKNFEQALEAARSPGIFRHRRQHRRAEG